MTAPLPASTELPSDLLPRLRLGDVAAFESLFRATHASLVAFATRYTGDEARAAELVQDLFLDLWTRRGSLEVRGSLRGYLFGAVRNRALNVRRRDALEHDWAADEAHDAVRTLHPAPPVADAAYESAELAERVRAAMDALPARCALVMQLRWREGLGYAEIAQVMGISTKGVENQLARGLKALRAVLA